MLNKISRYVIVLLIVFVCALFLPDFYSTLFDKKIAKPRLHYSPVSKDFVYSKYEGMGKLHYKEANGNELSEREYFQMLPFTYNATLEKWNQLPAEIDGFKLSSKSIRKNSQFFKVAPKYLGGPSIPVQMLFEAEPNYASLVVPDDVFRMNKRMEFIDPNTNSVIEDKTKLFTDALLDAGFEFPALNLGGNPTNRKPFDEGFFIEDAKHVVYHLKMVKGQPVIKKTGIPQDIKIRQINIKENLRREVYGLIVTKDDRVKFISYDNYKLIDLPVDLPEEVKEEKYVADEMYYYIHIEPLYVSINIKGDGFTYLDVLDKDYKPLNSHVMTWKRYNERPATVVKQYLFPFELSTYRPNGFIALDMECFLWQGLAGIVVSLIILFAVKRKRENAWFDYIIVLFTGIFGLIAVLLIKPEK